MACACGGWMVDRFECKNETASTTVAIANDLNKSKLYRYEFLRSFVTGQTMQRMHQQRHMWVGNRLIDGMHYQSLLQAQRNGNAFVHFYCDRSSFTWGRHIVLHSPCVCVRALEIEYYSIEFFSKLDGFKVEQLANRILPYSCVPRAHSTRLV